jgi:hypothetical protein
MKIPKNRKGKVHLTEDERALPNHELQALIASHGLSVNKVTVSRAKRRGWFLINGDRSIGRRAPHGYIRLTSEEREMDSSELIELFGITERTAKRAKRRGWFEIMQTNKDQPQIKSAKNRIKYGDLPST